MKDEKPKGRGGAKTTRSETITVRVEPKIRYLAEMAGRKQRRTLSSYIEWAIEESLNYVVLRDLAPYELVDKSQPSTVADYAGHLWQTSEAQRFARLAILFPELLTNIEEAKWAYLQRGELFKAARSVTTSGKVVWDWTVLDEQVFPQLEQSWRGLMNSFDAFPELREDLLNKVPTAK